MSSTPWYQWLIDWYVFGIGGWEGAVYPFMSSPKWIGNPFSAVLPLSPSLSSVLSLILFSCVPSSSLVFSLHHFCSLSVCVRSHACVHCVQCVHCKTHSGWYYFTLMLVIYILHYSYEYQKLLNITLLICFFTFELPQNLLHSIITFLSNLLLHVWCKISNILPVVSCVLEHLTYLVNQIMMVISQVTFIIQFSLLCFPYF